MQIPDGDNEVFWVAAVVVATLVLLLALEWLS